MGSRTYVVAVDIGTETGRAALVDADGSCVKIASVPFEADCPKPNWVQQDPETWWMSACRNIQQLLKDSDVDPSAIACVAVCGQMHAPVPLASDGSLVPGPVPLWCDKRTADLCDLLRASNDEKALAKLAGNPICPSWTGFKMAWTRENNPAVYEHTWKFLTCKDFINYRLTGRLRPTTPKLRERFSWTPRGGHGHRALRGSRRGYRQATAYPASGSRCGHGHERGGTANRSCGRHPVVTGGGDMMCILLGAGVAIHGVACDVTGTAADISVFCPSPVGDIRLMNLHHVAPGWIAFGILDAGGAA